MQKNLYKGTPARSWICMRLVAPDGRSRELDLVADTGSPFAIIVGSEVFEQCRHRYAPGVETNFGSMIGGFMEGEVLRTQMRQILHGYGSDRVVEAVQESSPDFEGLVGLPLLRMMRYGGNSDHFWIE